MRKRHRGKKGKKIEQHYKDQNELIDELLKPPGFVDEAEEANLVRVKRKIILSHIAASFSQRQT